MLAPTGEDVATRRVYGTVIPDQEKVDPAQPDPALRSLILSRHPELGQGAGPSLVYLVKDASGAVVESARQDAAFARLPATRAVTVPDGGSDEVERMGVVRARQSQAALSPGEERAALRMTADSIHMRQRQEKVAANGVLRRQGRAMAMPKEVPINFGALRPDDIGSIEITKFAAGRIGPDPVSLIMVSLKPGVRMPLREGAR